MKLDTITVFEVDDLDTDYGSRIRGFIQAPSSGEFTFFLRSDDSSTLALSTGHGPAEAVVIAEENGCCAPLYSGDRIGERSSGPISMERGKVYYYRVRRE